jgi:DNA-binding SARP family transcriptional activator
MPQQAQLRLFGGFALRDQEGRPVTLRLRKTEGLIAYLAVGATRRQSRQRLAGLLWSESSQNRALQSLRQARLTLNRDLAPHQLSIVHFGRREISLEEGALRIDAVEFSRLREAGDPDSLAQAADYFRGEFLAGIEIESEAFDEWLQPTRAWYREQLEGVLERLLALQEQAGAYEACIRTAKRLLAVDPLREDMHRWLMRAFAATGQRTSALAAYDACRTILQEELGVVPDVETEALHTAILHNAQQEGRWSRLSVAAKPDRVQADTRPGTATARVAPDGATSGVSLSNLSPAAQEVLRIAAVCHGHFGFALLEAISERTSDELDEAVHELQRQGLLPWNPGSRSGDLDEELRDKVVNQMLPSLKRHLHYAAAEAMGQRGRAALCGECYEIAEHYRQAEKWALCADLLIRLTRIELDQGNLASAEALLQRALTDLKQVPETDENGRALGVAAALLRFDLAEAGNDLARAEKILDETWPNLKALGVTNLWISALQARSRLDCRLGRTKDAYAALRLIPKKCLAVPTDLLWHPAERFADVAGVLTDESAGRRSPAQRVQGLGPRAGEVDQLLMEGLRQAKQDKYAAAYSACDRAISIAGELTDQTPLIIALQTLGLIQVWDGDPKNAVEALERAGKLASERGDLLRLYTSYGYLGFALVSAGKAALGQARLSEALDMAEKMDLRFMTAMFSAWYAEALVESGSVEQALELARKAAGHANERNETWARSVALRVLGQALARSSSDGAKLVDKILRSAQDMQNSLGLEFESERTANTRAEVSRLTH